MWLVNKTKEDQELVNKCLAKALKQENKRVSEGKLIEIALKEFIKRG